MPKYLLQVSYTNEGVKGLRKDAVRRAARLPRTPR